MRQIPVLSRMISAYMSYLSPRTMDKIIHIILHQWDKIGKVVPNAFKVGNHF